MGWQRILVLSLLSIAILTPRFAPNLRAQQESTPAKKAAAKFEARSPGISRPRAAYENLRSVKVQITIAPNGTVKDTKIIGGHPLLANAVIDAVRKWRFEARPQATTETLEFRFEPMQ